MLEKRSHAIILYIGYYPHPTLYVFCFVMLVIIYLLLAGSLVYYIWSFLQVSLDSISYSEELYAVKSASSDSFFDYTSKVIAVFGDKPGIDDQVARTVQEQSKRFGITYHGNSPNDNVVRSLQDVAPYRLIFTVLIRGTKLCTIVIHLNISELVFPLLS